MQGLVRDWGCKTDFWVSRTTRKANEQIFNEKIIILFFRFYTFSKILLVFPEKRGPVAENCKAIKPACFCVKKLFWGNIFSCKKLLDSQQKISGFLPEFFLTCSEENLLGYQNSMILSPGKFLRKIVICGEKVCCRSVLTLRELNRRWWKKNWQVC